MPLPIHLYIPNLLGYARIILAFVGLHLSDTQPGAAVVTWIFSATLDLFDGILARKLDQCSKLGVLVRKTSCWAFNTHFLRLWYETHLWSHTSFAIIHRSTLQPTIFYERPFGLPWQMKVHMEYWWASLFPWNGPPWFARNCMLLSLGPIGRRNEKMIRGCSNKYLPIIFGVLWDAWSYMDSLQPIYSYTAANIQSWKTRWQR